MDHLLQAGETVALGLAVLLWVSGVIRYIPNDRVGVVEKLWSARGSVKTGLLALQGEAGFQPELRRGGFHFFAPFQYRIFMAPINRWMYRGRHDQWQCVENHSLSGSRICRSIKIQLERRTLTH